MKISTRLALAFSCIASTVFIVFGIITYWFSANHRSLEFNERLMQRTLITKKIFLKKDSFSRLELKKINAQFLNTLPKETEEVIEINNTITPIFKYKYAQDIKESLLKVDNFYFRTNDTQGLGKIFNFKKKKYLVIVTAVDQTGLRNLAFLKQIIILLILIGIPVILLGSYIITKRALQPLTNKIHHANAIGVNNLHQRLKVFNPTDEIGELAIAFNKLLDRLEASFEAQKSFISNASHEIKNPLTAIIGESEIAVSKPRKPEDYIEAIHNILLEAEMLNTTVNNLLQLSKITANETNVIFEIIDVEAFIKDVKSSFDFMNPANKIKLVFNLFKPCIVYGNRNLLKSALFNLFDNACKFSNNSNVSVDLITIENGLNISISDKGIGISQTDISNIKEPFYRGKNTLNINGSGIGLSLTAKIIELHKGTLQIQSELDEGTDVQIHLPLYRA